MISRNGSAFLGPCGWPLALALALVAGPASAATGTGTRVITGKVAPGRSPGCVIDQGNMSFEGGASLKIEIPSAPAVSPVDLVIRPREFHRRGVELCRSCPSSG